MKLSNYMLLFNKELVLISLELHRLSSSDKLYPSLLFTNIYKHIFIETR